VSCKTISEARARTDTLCYIHDFHVSQISHFRPMTQPSPLKMKISDLLPAQPNPGVNPTHGQLWFTILNVRLMQLKLLWWKR